MKKQKFTFTVKSGNAPIVITKKFKEGRYIYHIKREDKKSGIKVCGVALQDLKEALSYIV